MREGQILNLPLREWENERSTSNIQHRIMNERQERISNSQHGISKGRGKERPTSNVQHRIMNERQERISNSQHSISNIHIQGKREENGKYGYYGSYVPRFSFIGLPVQFIIYVLTVCYTMSNTL